MKYSFCCEWQPRLASVPVLDGVPPPPDEHCYWRPSIKGKLELAGKSGPPHRLAS